MTFASTRERQHPFLVSTFQQAWQSIKLSEWSFAVLFFIGILLFLFYISLSLKKVINKESVANKLYFIMLWLVISLIFFGKTDWVDYMEERYYFIFYPALFLVAGKGLSFIYDFIKDYGKKIAIIAILIILLFGAYQNIKHTNEIIAIKKDSFIQLKLGGEYIKANTKPDESFLIIEETAEVLYYSDRKFILIQGFNTTTLLKTIDKEKPKYAFISFYYSINRKPDQEVLNFIFSNQNIFKPVQAYPPYINQEQTLPLAVLFEIDQKEIEQAIFKETLKEVVS